MLQVKRKKS